MQRTQRPLLARLARVEPDVGVPAALVLVLVAFFTPGPVGGLLLLALAGGPGLPCWRPPGRCRRRQTRLLRLVMLTLLVDGGPGEAPLTCNHAFLTIIIVVTDS